MNAFNRLDIRQLRTLHYLLREQNVSRVADQLGVTQQAVSDQLKKLRITFNDRLFIRRGNGIAPTPFAEALQPKVINALNALEQLVEPLVFDPGHGQQHLHRQLYRSGTKNHPALFAAATA